MIQFLTIIVLAGVAIADPIPSSAPSLGVPKGRIVGGEDTEIEEAPYQVSISVNGRHYCGGSIIGDYWIITAAHCATLPASLYLIRAGSSHSHIGGSIHRVSRVFSHERFVTAANGVPTNDIALFKLATPVAIGVSRRAIKLYESGEEAEPGMYAVVTGWGRTSKAISDKPQLLQSISVPIISKRDCRAAYQKLTIINPGQICAASSDGKKDACQGDSGGPLVVQGRLAGIVSWGNGCANPLYPGVYTEIAYFRAWIARTMEM